MYTVNNTNIPISKYVKIKCKQINKNTCWFIHSSFYYTFTFHFIEFSIYGEKNKGKRINFWGKICMKSSLHLKKYYLKGVGILANWLSVSILSSFLVSSQEKLYSIAAFTMGISAITASGKSRFWSIVKDQNNYLEWTGPIF